MSLCGERNPLGRYGGIEIQHETAATPSREGRVDTSDPVFQRPFCGKTTNEQRAVGQTGRAGRPREGSASFSDHTAGVDIRARDTHCGFTPETRIPCGQIDRDSLRAAAWCQRDGARQATAVDCERTVCAAFDQRDPAGHVGLGYAQLPNRDARRSVGGRQQGEFAGKRTEHRPALGIDSEALLARGNGHPDIFKPGERLTEDQGRGRTGLGYAGFNCECAVIGMAPAAGHARGSVTHAAIERHGQLARIDPQPVEIERAVAPRGDTPAYADRRPGKIGQRGIGNGGNPCVEFRTQPPGPARLQREVDNRRAPRGTDIVER